MVVPRVLITAGGTGGHLYPAQALAQQLAQQPYSSTILFVAGGLTTNRYFDRTRFSFQEITCSPLISRHPLKSLKGILHLVQGFKQSVTILKHYQPDVVVGFGSYYTVPAVLAAKWLNIPIILYEADSVLGKANRWLAPFATSIALHFPSATSSFKKKTIEIDLPLREGYQLASISKEQALAYYGLSTQHSTLLICGGSQGAQAINRLIRECLPLFQRLALQVIHLTGNAQMTAELTAHYASFGVSASVKDFEPQMQMAWRAADGFLGRSGAATIAEALEFEVPGILIPYPHATNQHQEKNADFMVQTVKAAWKLLEPQLTAKQLANTIERFYQKEQHLLFQEALRAYKQNSQRMALCQLVQNIHSAKGK